MKLAIFGAGAIGGFLGVHLASSGAEVSLVARGAHLAAMRADGVRLQMVGTERVARLTYTDDPSQLGVQDYLVIALKAHDITAALPAMAPLIGPATTVVTTSNGLPYWHFHVDGVPHRGTVLDSVDPGGLQWRALLSAGGLEAPLRDDIRNEIWLKLCGNVCFNPISALTLATLDVIAGDPGTRALCASMMEEAKAVGERLGVELRVDLARRLAGAAAVGPHRMSMLQDLEHGRSLEIEPLVGAVQELGRLTDVPTPTVDVLLALIRRRAASARLH